MSPLAVPEALVEACSTLSRRGVNAHPVLDALLSVWSSFSNIPKSYLSSPRFLGGAGLLPWNHSLVPTKSLPVNTDFIHITLKNPADPWRQTRAKAQWSRIPVADWDRLASDQFKDATLSDDVVQASSVARAATRAWLKRNHISMKPFLTHPVIIPPHLSQKIQAVLDDPHPFDALSAAFPLPKTHQFKHDIEEAQIATRYAGAPSVAAWLKENALTSFQKLKAFSRIRTVDAISILTNTMSFPVYPIHPMLSSFITVPISHLLHYGPRNITKAQLAAVYRYANDLIPLVHQSVVSTRVFQF